MENYPQNISPLFHPPWNPPARRQPSLCHRCAVPRQPLWPGPARCRVAQLCRRWKLISVWPLGVGPEKYWEFLKKRWEGGIFEWWKSGKTCKQLGIGRDLELMQLTIGQEGVIFVRKLIIFDFLLPLCKSMILCFACIMFTLYFTAGISICLFV